MKVKIGDKIESHLAFTGLCDVNNVEIYEGDTVLYKSRDGRVVLILEVCFDLENSRFELTQKGTCYRSPLHYICSKQITEKDENGWIVNKTVVEGDNLKVISPDSFNDKDIRILNLEARANSCQASSELLKERIKHFNSLPWFKKIFKFV